MAPRSDRLVITAPQGVNSTTWRAPPFNGPMTVPELYAFHARESPEHPVYVFDDDQGEVQTLRYKDVFRGARKAASIVSRHVPPTRTATAEGTKGPVVGILAIADPITLMTLCIGVMYLGYTVFPLSVRNSAPAIVHLVRRTSLRHLFVSQDPSMQRLAHEAKDLLAAEDYEVEILPLPEFQHLYNEREDGLDIEMGPLSEEGTCLILHSSGSTSFPKPIPFPHRHLTRWGFLSYYGDYDSCGMRIGMHCLPIFHIMGCLSLAWPVCTGVVMAVFRPSIPPVVVTPETVLRSAVATKCDNLLCVPALLEAWARSPENVEHLAKFKAIVYAGAPLNPEVAEALLDRGLKLVTAYGSTEAGAIARALADPNNIPRDEFEYFSFSPAVELVRVYQEGLPGVFEPVIVDSPSWSPNVFNTVVDGRPAYATSDLFEEHPTKPHLYRVYGRVDDQIVLSTGEKTNPVPIEAVILQDPNVVAAIVFGRGRFQNGVIIQPEEPFDPSDAAKLEEFRNKIWPTVERANKIAPSHSRIFKEMITVTKPGKPFQYTAKGTPRRHVSLADYAEEIDELYARVEESSQVGVPPPSSWTGEAVLEYVRSVVKKVLRSSNVGDEDDLFQQGCDSLQATWIRNTILHAIRTTTKIPAYEVPINFIYANPTIASLGAFLTGLLAGKSVDRDAELAKRLTQMKELVEKYMRDWPKPRWTSDTDGDAHHVRSGETILLTGTTGRFGSHLLSQLLQKPGVKRVYALNREPTGDAAKLADRQRKAFETWGLDPGLLSSQTVSFHPAEFDKPNFGLSEDVYAEIQASATSVLHIAWRVDFNVTLPSYEPLIAGARNMLDLALKSPLPGGPSVLFFSSVASMRNYASDVPVPETLDLGPELAIGTGYGESKWVTEQIFHRAAQDTEVKAIVVRAGQLSGDTRLGGWSKTEWVPAMVRMGQLMGCLPAGEGTVSWVPVDVAASALLEMLHGGEHMLHLVCPRPVPWNDVVGALAAELGVPLVPASEWVAKLRQAAQDAAKGPNVERHESAHNLVPFLETSMERKEVKLDTAKAVKVSKTLASMKPVGKEDAAQWMRFWRAIGFL
ncbi:acetyl-CoA synthetase-like protein [Trametes punicea]|nr:acetyl-CoA synthetase-like protein [Trametes punicea]